MGLLSSLGKSISKGFKSFSRTLGKTGNVFSGIGSFLDSTQADVEDAWDDYTGKSIAEKNLKLQREQFDYQKMLNEKQMQREDTSYQRKVADMTKAGFNPILATGGSGEPSTPLKAAAAPQLENYSGGVRDAISQVVSLMTMKKNFAQQDAQIRLMNSQSEEVGAKIELLGAERDKALAEADNLRVNNQFLGRMLDAKAYGIELDNQLKEGTLDNKIKLVASQLSISKKEELIKDMERMLGQQKYDIGKIEQSIKELERAGKLTENQILDKKLELLTTQVLYESLKYDNYKYDTEWYHAYKLPTGFNPGWIGNLGWMIGGLGTVGVNYVIDFFSSLFGSGSGDPPDPNSPPPFKYSKKEWKEMIKQVTKRPKSDNYLWDQRMMVTQDYGVRRNFVD